MLFDGERSLAWALVEATAPHLGTAQRNDVHVAIGVGETFAVIDYLITSAADRRVTVPAELVHGCTWWLDVYAGHEDECYLRGVVEYVLTQTAAAPGALAGNSSVGVASVPARNGGDYQSVQLASVASSIAWPTPTGPAREFRTYRRPIE